MTEEHCEPYDLNLDNDTEYKPFSTAMLRDRRGVTAEWCCVITTFIDQNKARGFRLVDEVKHDLEKQHAVVQAQPPSYDSVFASKDYINVLEQAFPLPGQLGTPFTRLLRRTLFDSYTKLFTLALVLNLSAQIAFLLRLKHPHSTTTHYENAALAAICNFCAGVVMRNEHIVNILFRTACATPQWMPLFFRRRIAKVYCYGGLHSACMLSGSLWYLIFFGLYTYEFQAAIAVDVILLVTTGLVMGLLVTIITFALPLMRQRYHNQFEMTHRFLGWAVVACFWMQTILLAYTNPGQKGGPWQLTLFQTPQIWLLSIVTLCICYPWLRLRKREIQAERLSEQAVRLRFTYSNMDTCYGVRLTDDPLKETHSFATIPSTGKEAGFSVLISAAGDWTQKIVRNLPSYVWVRGAPVIGMARIALIFKKVLIVATGAGIGPCLSLLQSLPEYPCRVLWSARMPVETYDAETIESVLRADPEAVILDSRYAGRRNLLNLAYSLFRESQAEAVIVISNPNVVRDVVGGLETRGVPAYGPIFDS